MSALQEEEKQRLVDDVDDKDQLERSSSPPYGTAAPSDDSNKDTYNGYTGPNNKTLWFLYEHRQYIPGYGVYNMVRKVKVYALYVLLMMLAAYLINQLDRYTLPIVTKYAGYDLQYGDLECMKTHNSTVLDLIQDEDYNITSNITSLCGEDDDPDIKQNETLCYDVIFEVNGTTYDACEWSYSGTGLLYQIVAGPVFNNLYPLAGIFMGFLADYGCRTFWLVASLIFWSLATGLTGFVKTYWHLVILRALLAIGAAGCTPFAISVLGDYFPADFRASAIGIYYFGIYIGYSLAFAIGNGIVGVLNWRWVFFISALLGLGVAPIILFTVKEPKRTKNLKIEQADEVKKPSLRIGDRILLILRTFFYPGMFMLCIAGGIRNAGGYVWAYNTEVFFQKQGLTDDQISRFMSWIPLVGGSLGAVFGGLISDLLVRNRSTYVRIWVLIVSQLCAAPFAAGALFLPNPWCFISLIPSNLFGEMWVGVTSAIVVDLAPTNIRTGVIAVYLFIITIIGGNFNLLVVPITKGFENHFSTLTSYRLSLSMTFPGLYALSSLLFIATFFLMKLDIGRKQRLDRNEVININATNAEYEEDNPPDYDEVAEQDKPV